MNIERRPFGTMPDGTRIDVVELSNSTGISVRLIAFGATLVSVQTPNARGKVEEITLGYDILQSYLRDHPYFGATIGRVANRIRGARFQLNNRDYVLTRNEGGISIHGGKQGFSRHVWEMEIEGKQDSASVIFVRHSPSGEQGYPGAVDVRVCYTLNERNELIIEYNASADRLTPVSLTNHAYWNLCGDQHSLVYDHDLVLYGDFYLPNADDMIPNGQIVPVDGTSYDFRARKRIGRDIDRLPNGYDCCWTLGSERAEKKHPLEDIPAGQRPVAFVREPRSRRTMQVFSTKPGVQFYTGNFLDGVTGRDGERLVKQSALCLETQYYPNAINTPEFPSILIKRGKPYHHITTHRFGIMQR